MYAPGSIAAHRVPRARLRRNLRPRASWRGGIQGLGFRETFTTDWRAQGYPSYEAWCNDPANACTDLDPEAYATFGKKPSTWLWAIGGLVLGFAVFGGRR